MRKKLTALVLSLVMCLGIGTTAMAAPSPEVTYGATAVINGQAVQLNLIMKGPGSMSSNKVESDALVAFFKEFEVVMDGLAESYYRGELTDEQYQAKWQEAMDVHLVAALKKYVNVTCKKVNWFEDGNLLLPEGVTIPEGGMDVTIKDSSIKAGKNIVLIHIKSDGSFERIPVTVTDGAITGKFTSLSPIIYMEIEGEGETAGNVSSPKTGDTDLVIWAAVVGVLALGCLVFVNRRKASL